MVTWLASVSRGYMICARVESLHGLRACRMVTWFARDAWLHGLRVSRVYRVCRAYSPGPSPTACDRIRELQRCSVSSNHYNTAIYAIIVPLSHTKTAETLLKHHQDLARGSLGTRARAW